ncbi:MAG: hypothetical protein R2699_05395 [Acidimicrobiales bacterium]|nr:hypothetical protein [Acidimicrobiales bacterium]MCB1260838.1 hypothetical protein [Acidimicrobiales bacterium]
MRRVIAGVVLTLSVAGVAAGCSNTLTKEDFAKELTSQGIDSALATCITDELAAKGFNFRKYGDLSAEEEAQITDATVSCASSAAGIDLDSLDGAGG